MGSRPPVTWGKTLFLVLPGLFLASASTAQQVTIDLGGEGSLSLHLIQIFGLITILSVAPGLAIMVTCFPFIVTVLSILRQAIGLQQAPPNMMIVSLALFLTYFVMEPVVVKSWAEGIQPLLQGSLSFDEGYALAISPFRAFMRARVDPDTLDALWQVRNRATAGDHSDLAVLVPAFMLGEIERAFEIGFLVFLPFLIIDLVVSAVLMSMGMMMVPPAVVALPFKLAFFVVVDGWGMLSAALVRSYL